jgi:hypothetical protein
MSSDVNYGVVSPEEFIDELVSSSRVNKKHVRSGVVLRNIDFGAWDDILISNCLFDDECLIVDLKVRKGIKFYNCIFSRRVNIFGFKWFSLGFERCKFGHFISFKDVVSNNIDFIECSFANERIGHIHEFVCNNLVFKSNVLRSDIHFKPKRVKKIVLEGSESASLITFSYLNRTEILDEILIFTYQGLKTDFLIRNAATRKLQIGGELKDSTIVLSRISVGSLVLDGFSNYGNIKATFIEALDDNSSMILKNSNLGKIQVSSTDFTKFKRVLINNTSMIEVVPVNIKRCYDNIFSDNITAKKESYRQLKLINQRNEDTDSKLRYERYEMHTFMKLMRELKGDYKDRFVLFTNYVSNDFGLSWSRCAFLLIVLSTIAYACIKIQLGQVYFDSKLIADEIGLFLIFVNPIHQFEKVFFYVEAKYANGALLIDSISRVVNAYLIFQLVSAFRKYSKK